MEQYNEKKWNCILAFKASFKKSHAFCCCCSTHKAGYLAKANVKGVRKYNPYKDRQKIFWNETQPTTYSKVPM